MNRVMYVAVALCQLRLPGAFPLHRGLQVVSRPLETAQPHARLQSPALTEHPYSTTLRALVGAAAICCACAPPLTDHEPRPGINRAFHHRHPTTAQAVDDCSRPRARRRPRLCPPARRQSPTPLAVPSGVARTLAERRRLTDRRCPGRGRSRIHPRSTPRPAGRTICRPSSTGWRFDPRSTSWRRLASSSLRRSPSRAESASTTLKSIRPRACRSSCWRSGRRMARGNGWPTRTLERDGDFVSVSGLDDAHWHACSRSVARLSPRRKTTGGSPATGFSVRITATLSFPDDSFDPPLLGVFEADPSRGFRAVGDADGPDNQNLSQAFVCAGQGSGICRYPLQRPEPGRGGRPVRSAGFGPGRHRGRGHHRADLRGRELRARRSSKYPIVLIPAGQDFA